MNTNRIKIEVGEKDFDSNGERVEQVEDRVDVKLTSKDSKLQQIVTGPYFLNHIGNTKNKLSEKAVCKPEKLLSLLVEDVCRSLGIVDIESESSDSTSLSRSSTNHNHFPIDLIVVLICLSYFSGEEEDNWL